MLRVFLFILSFTGVVSPTAAERPPSSRPHYLVQSYFDGGKNPDKGVLGTVTAVCPLEKGCLIEAEVRSQVAHFDGKWELCVSLDGVESCVDQPGSPNATLSQGYANVRVEVEKGQHIVSSYTARHVEDFKVWDVAVRVYSR